jgi:cell division protein FtsB
VRSRIGREAVSSRLTARPGLTGRALVLGGVLVLLVVLLAAPLHRYLGARSAITAAAQQRKANLALQAEMQRELAQWNDPRYVEQQARRRLSYAMPGDTVYVVVRPGEHSGLDSGAPPSTRSTSVPGGTWNQRLWGSVRVADRTP